MSPTLLYNLELTHQELLSLWLRLSLLDLEHRLIDQDEKQVLAKLIRLMEGQ